jgi:SynChlorMet cassette protein ScmD
MEYLNSKIIIPNPLVVLREESDNWAILFNPENAKVVGINPTGVVIWNLINGRRRIADIFSEINEYFTDVPITATEEISIFIDEIYKNGFVGYA